MNFNGQGLPNMTYSPNNTYSLPAQESLNTPSLGLNSFIDEPSMPSPLLPPELSQREYSPESSSYAENVFRGNSPVRVVNRLTLPRRSESFQRTEVDDSMHETKDRELTGSYDEDSQHEYAYFYSQSFYPRVARHPDRLPSSSRPSPNQDDAGFSEPPPLPSEENYQSHLASQYQSSDYGSSYSSPNLSTHDTSTSTSRGYSDNHYGPQPRLRQSNVSPTPFESHIFANSLQRDASRSPRDILYNTNPSSLTTRGGLAEPPPISQSQSTSSIPMRNRPASYPIHRHPVNAALEAYSLSSDLTPVAERPQFSLPSFPPSERDYTIPSTKGGQQDTENISYQLPGPSSSASTAESSNAPMKKKKKSKMHECKVCRKQFPRPSGLKTHMNTHNNIKPFICDFPGCHRTFGVRSNAKRHLRTHGIDPTSSSSDNIDTPYVIDFSQPIVLPDITPRQATQGGSRDNSPSASFFKLRWVPQRLSTRSNSATLGPDSAQNSFSEEGEDEAGAQRDEVQSDLDGSRSPRSALSTPPVVQSSLGTLPHVQPPCSSSHFLFPQRRCCGLEDHTNCTLCFEECNLRVGAKPRLPSLKTLQDCNFQGAPLDYLGRSPSSNVSYVAHFSAQSLSSI